MSESAPESLPIAESASPVLTSGLPFAFAQSRNVLLERSGAALTLHYVPPLATDVLLEVRRHVGEVFSLAPLDEDPHRVAPMRIPLPRDVAPRVVRLSPAAGHNAESGLHRSAQATRCGSGQRQRAVPR